MNKLIVCVGAKGEKMESGERRSYNRGLVIVAAVLLVIIIFLLSLLLKPTPEPDEIETGNVDVFDIRIGCICKGKNGEDCDPDKEDKDGFIPGTSPGSNGYSGSNGTNGYSEKTINGKTDTDVEEDGIVYVDDTNGWYVYQKSLRIFQNAAFQYKDKIAPGVSNSYNFKVHNETNNAIRYSIEFEDDSQYAVNMLYRLKRGGEYIVGSDTQWVKAKELVSALKLLQNDKVDSYTLDWNWPYDGGVDAADTNAGKNATDYRLGVKINFEEV